MRRIFILILLVLTSSCSIRKDEPDILAAPDPSELVVVPIMPPGTRNIEAFEIQGPDGAVLHRIEMLEGIDRTSTYSFWLFRLPYDDWTREGIRMWDPVPIPGVPTLVVMEYTPPGNAPESYQWVMRIILYEDGQFREIPPIRGYGEIFYFRDFDGSGSMEFANSDLLRWHDQDAEGIPISPYVYRFDGERYVPVTDEQTWDDALERYWKDREAKEQLIHQGD